MVNNRSTIWYYVSLAVTLGFMAQVHATGGSDTLSFFNQRGELVQVSQEGSSLQLQRSLIATASGNTVTVYNSETMQELASTTLRSISSIESMAMSPNGRYIAVRGDDNANLAVWDTWDTQDDIAVIKRTAQGTAYNYYDFAWSPDSTKIVYGDGDDDKVYVWNVTDDTVQSVVSQTNNPYAVAWSPDGSTIAYAGSNGKVYFLDVDSLNNSGDLSWGRGSGKIYSLAYSPDGTQLAIGRNETGFNDEIIVGKVQGSQIWAKNLSGDDDVYWLKWSPDGIVIAYTGRNTSDILSAGNGDSVDSDFTSQPLASWVPGPGAISFDSAPTPTAAMQAVDGSIYVAGTTELGEVFLVKTNAYGEVDTSFNAKNTPGMVVLSTFSLLTYTPVALYEAAGMLYVVVHSTSFNNYKTLSHSINGDDISVSISELENAMTLTMGTLANNEVVRVMYDGETVQMYNSTIDQTLSFDASSLNPIFHALVLPDSTIIVGGIIDGTSGKYMWLAKIKKDDDANPSAYIVDASFGTNGIVTFTDIADFAEIHALKADDAQTVYVVGSLGASGANEQLFVYAVDANTGSLVTRFANNGVFTQAGSGEISFVGLQIMESGSVLVAGQDTVDGLTVQSAEIPEYAVFNYTHQALVIKENGNEVATLQPEELYAARFVGSVDVEDSEGNSLLAGLTLDADNPWISLAYTIANSLQQQKVANQGDLAATVTGYTFSVSSAGPATTVQIGDVGPVHIDANTQQTIYVTNAQPTTNVVLTNADAVGQTATKQISEIADPEVIGEDYFAVLQTVINNSNETLTILDGENQWAVLEPGDQHTAVFTQSACMVQNADEIVLKIRSGMDKASSEKVVLDPAKPCISLARSAKSGRLQAVAGIDSDAAQLEVLSYDFTNNLQVDILLQLGSLPFCIIEPAQTFTIRGLDIEAWMTVFVLPVALGGNKFFKIPIPKVSDFTTEGANVVTASGFTAPNLANFKGSPLVLQIVSVINQTDTDYALGNNTQNIGFVAGNGVESKVALAGSTLQIKDSQGNVIAEEEITQAYVILQHDGNGDLVVTQVDAVETKTIQIPDLPAACQVRAEKDGVTSVLATLPAHSSGDHAVLFANVADDAQVSVLPVGSSQAKDLGAFLDLPDDPIIVPLADLQQTQQFTNNSGENLEIKVGDNDWQTCANTATISQTFLPISPVPVLIKRANNDELRIEQDITAQSADPYEIVAAHLSDPATGITIANMLHYDIVVIDEAGREIEIPHYQATFTETGVDSNILEFFGSNQVVSVAHSGEISGQRLYGSCSVWGSQPSVDNTFKSMYLPFQKLSENFIPQENKVVVIAQNVQGEVQVFIGDNVDSIKSSENILTHHIKNAHQDKNAYINFVENFETKALYKREENLPFNLMLAPGESGGLSFISQENVYLRIWQGFDMRTLLEEKVNISVSDDLELFSKEWFQQHLGIIIVLGLITALNCTELCNFYDITYLSLLDPALNRGPQFLYSHYRSGSSDLQLSLADFGLQQLQVGAQEDVLLTDTDGNIVGVAPGGSQLPSLIPIGQSIQVRDMDENILIDNVEVTGKAMSVHRDVATGTIAQTQAVDVETAQTTAGLTKRVVSVPADGVATQFTVGQVSFVLQPGQTREIGVTGNVTSVPVTAQPEGSADQSLQENLGNFGDLPEDDTTEIDKTAFGDLASIWVVNTTQAPQTIVDGTGDRKVIAANSVELVEVLAGSLRLVGPQGDLYDLAVDTSNVFVTLTANIETGKVQATTADNFVASQPTNFKQFTFSNFGRTNFLAVVGHVFSSRIAQGSQSQFLGAGTASKVSSYQIVKK